MVKKLKPARLLSLQEIAVRRLTVSLWSSSDIFAPLLAFQFDWLIKKITKEWKETFEREIKARVQKLELPESLKERMLEIVRPVGLQIEAWKHHHECRSLNEVKQIVLPDSTKLCWTTAGAIDYKKTAEELVNCDDLNVAQRYELACINCLEDEIPLLWEKLTKIEKAYFYDKLLNEKIATPSLCFVWPHILKGKLSNLDYLLRESNRTLTSFNQWAFEESGQRYDRVAAEYFYLKLTHEEGDVSITRILEGMIRERDLFPFRYFEGCDVLCHLFLLMTPEKQMEMIQNHTIEVFFRFHDSPWPNIFFENSELFWTFIPSHRYGELLSKIDGRLSRFYPFFPRFFREFYIQAPLDFKKGFVGEMSQPDRSPALGFLCKFLETEDSESIEAMLMHVLAADRLWIVSSPNVFRYFFQSILKDKWSGVETCLRKLSKEDRKSVMEAFMRFLDRTIGGKCVERKFKHFFKFVDEID